MDTNKDIILAIICSTLLILLLIVVLVLVFFISGKRRIKQEIQITQNKLSFERELRQVETEVSEYIMGQFAQELHDNIGQLLTAMHVQIENQKLDHPELTERLKPIEIYLSEINQQLRLLSRTFNNDYLGHIGLFAAIQLEVDRLRSLKRFEIHWPQVHGNSNLDKNQELMVFRIFQEISQNVLRHSGARNLYISINNQDKVFELNVHDDGKGFNTEEVLKSQKASGLRNIIKRVHLAGLKYEVESSISEGCSYKIKN